MRTCYNLSRLKILKGVVGRSRAIAAAAMPQHDCALRLAGRSETRLLEHANYLGIRARIEGPAAYRVEPGDAFRCAAENISRYCVRKIL
jgi:hypothetical protein